MSQETIMARQQQVLHDEKWIKLLRRTWLFRYIPFVEFALIAGSMATGKVHAGSDFDVIIGARQGRIFTVRCFSVIAFGLFGWRRTKMDHNESAADKICLNHFITERAYRLSPPHNEYWKDLYKNLVPVYGTTEKISAFFAANKDWLDDRGYVDDLRHLHHRSSWMKKVYEWILGGSFGDWMERRLRAPQIGRIEKNASVGYKPRIIYNDDELEFHPHTKRIEEFSK